jgi:HSF-type DNA-binding
VPSTCAVNSSSSPIWLSLRAIRNTLWCLRGILFLRFVDVNSHFVSVSAMQSSTMNIGALNRLVEAATALAQLTDKVAQPGSTTPVISREIFPQRLMAMLQDDSLNDVISWLPHGKSFVIVRPDVFTERVLPKFLPPVDARSCTKYPSFTRKLNRWYVCSLFDFSVCYSVNFPNVVLSLSQGVSSSDPRSRHWRLLSPAVSSR